LQRHFGEEPGERAHVAVDALDQLARRVCFVERHIELEAVRGQVETQGVGGFPGNGLAQIGDAERDRLSRHGDAQEEQRHADQRGALPPRDHRIDETPQNLRV